MDQKPFPKEFLDGHQQTRDTIKAWMKEHASVGMIVVIRCGVAHLNNEYLLDIITELKPRNGRVWTKTPLSHKAVYGGSYYYSGQSCDDPAGQVEMLIPTPEIVQAAIECKLQIHSRAVHNTLITQAITQTKHMFGECLKPPVDE